MVSMVLVNHDILERAISPLRVILGTVIYIEPTGISGEVLLLSLILLSAQWA